MLTTQMLLALLKPFLFLFILFGGVFFLRLFFIKLQYNDSQYGSVSGNKFLPTVFDKGNYGEFLTFRMLEKVQGYKKLLTNVYIPKKDGSTTEIDLLMVHKTGVYVFESKNYSGWIFGNDKSKNWTQTLKSGKKNSFFNPIWQNKGHINALENLLTEVNSSCFHSYIVFSERCELKKLSVNTPNVCVLKRNSLLSALQKDISRKQDIFPDNMVFDLYMALNKYSLADRSIKEQHIKNIQEKSQSI